MCIPPMPALILWKTGSICIVRYVQSTLYSFCSVVSPIMQLYAYWHLLFIFYILYLCNLFTRYIHIDMLLYMWHTWYSIMHINNSYMCSWWRYIHSDMIQVDCLMGCAIRGIKKTLVSMKISSQAIPIRYALCSKDFENIRFISER